jgi:hypothetical protein
VKAHAVLNGTSCAARAGSDTHGIGDFSRATTIVARKAPLGVLYTQGTRGPQLAGRSMA